jgi:MFS family permease
MHDASKYPTRTRVFAATNIVLLLLCLMYLLIYIDRVNVSTASNVFEKELNLNKTQVGFIFSVFAYPYLIFQIIGGYLGDRFGPRKVLTVCSLIWGLATILTGFVNGFATMVIARLLLGFGEGATFPTATSAMARWTRPVDRGFAQGITHAFSRVGNSLTPPMLELKDSALFATGVFFAGVIGDALGGVISDLILRKTRDLQMARRNLVVICFLCSLVCMIPLFLTRNLTILAICLAAAFFFAEMTIGPMWAIPMDIAPRYAGSASGIMNCGSALPAILSPVTFGYVIDQTQNWELPFIGSMTVAPRLFRDSILLPMKAGKMRQCILVCSVPTFAITKRFSLNTATKAGITAISARAVSINE